MDDDDGVWNVRSLKELHDEKIKADRTAVTIAGAALAVIVGLGWHEIQRRLVVLNHAHEQHEDTLAASVTADKYESDKKAGELRLAAIETKQTASEERERGSERAASRAEGVRSEQRTGQRQTVALILSAAAIIVTVIIAITVSYHA